MAPGVRPHNSREASLPSDTILALSVETKLKIPSIDYGRTRSYVKSQLGPIAQSWSLFRKDTRASSGWRNAAPSL